MALRKLLVGLQWLFTGHAGLLSDAAASLPYWRRAATPLIGAAIAIFIMWYGIHKRRARAFEEYIGAVRHHDGEIPFEPTFWRTIASAFSVATGAAIGREGSMIQFAAAVVSWCGERVPGVKLTRQIACGVAAAVAVVYQAPIAGVFFASEIVCGGLLWKEFPFFAVASYTGLFISQFFLEPGPIFPAIGPISLDAKQVALCVLLAVIAGLLGPVYYWIIHSTSAAGKLPLALAWGGAAVGVLSLLRTEVWGNGDAALLEMMRLPLAMHVVVLILVLRLFATTFCVGTGTIGGVFTPTVFAGSAVGLIFGHMLHLPTPLLFAVVGICGLLAAATHSPLMSAFMAVELTGEWNLLLLTLACSAIAWGIARSLSSRSLYMLATPKPATGGKHVESEVRL
ncbi:chloride channel protein [Silvibacterium acidisoli]|uniref:chloride channel protein n=1 Tax=Acidobacteriaceae bacterium ZG23-2 TaxID=2883246 RepID=UPI00406C960B